MKAPTLALAEKAVGNEKLLIMLTGAMKQAMTDYFSEEQRLAPEMCAAFAENILEDFRHESVGDIVVFVRRASMGRYGDGKTFGRLTTTTLGRWWTQYLDDKAGEAEIERLRSKSNDTEIHESLAHSLRLATEDERERNEAREIAKLVKYGHLLTDDQLREKWKKVRSSHGRSLIMRLANDRGLAVKRIEEHLSKLETPKP